MTINIDHTTAGTTTLRAPSSGTATLTFPPVPGSTQMVTIDSSGAFASQAIPSSGALADTSVQTTTYTASAGQNVLLNASGMQSSNTVTFSNGPNYMNYASGLPENGTEVVISNSGGALPGGVTANTRYFITTSTGTIGSSGYTQLSLTRGGSPVDITTDGSGTNTATVISKQVSLPASPSVGDRVRFTLRTADTIRTWLPSFNGSTVNGGSDIQPYRLVQVGEWIEFVCTASGAWQVIDTGFRTSIGKGVRTSSAAINGTSTLIQFTQADLQNGMTVRTGSTSAIVVRRGGQYRISAFASAPQASDITLFFNNVLKWVGGSVTYTTYCSNGASYPSACNPTLTTALTAGQEISLNVNTGATETDTNRAIWFEACEIITEF